MPALLIRHDLASHVTSLRRKRRCSCRRSELASTRLRSTGNGVRLRGARARKSFVRKPAAENAFRDGNVKRYGPNSSDDYITK
jgi:hypothetical protein